MNYALLSELYGNDTLLNYNSVRVSPINDTINYNINNKLVQPNTYNIGSERTDNTYNNDKQYGYINKDYNDIYIKNVANEYDFNKQKKPFMVNPYTAEHFNSANSPMDYPSITTPNVMPTMPAQNPKCGLDHCNEVIEHLNTCPECLDHVRKYLGLNEIKNQVQRIIDVSVYIMVGIIGIFLFYYITQKS
jgi:hypothetical protein